MALRNVGNYHITRRRHNPEDHDVNLHRSENLKSRKTWLHKQGDDNGDCNGNNINLNNNSTIIMQIPKNMQAKSSWPWQ
jgi:hypothetical protein